MSAKVESIPIGGNEFCYSDTQLPRRNHARTNFVTQQQFPGDVPLPPTTGRDHAHTAAGTVTGGAGAAAVTAAAGPGKV